MCPSPPHAPTPSRTRAPPGFELCRPSGGPKVRRYPA
ncbi:uncharacterized protein J3R85_004551 [Psidium guajava]|nr:uncharacterized protein J3R85_004551 [Psidium guajava]